MKTIIIRLLVLSLLLALPSCSKKPVEVTGQIFVITQGRENIKMGGVEVLVVPDEEFRKKAKEVVTWMQQDVKAEAQRKVDSDHMTDFINEVIELEKTSPWKIPELTKIRESIVKESDAASKILNSVLAGDLKARALRMLLGGNEKMEFTTDADGKFIAPIIGKAWFFAAATRKVGDETEDYLWVKDFEAPKGVASSSLVISNDEDIDSEDGIYALVAGVCEVEGHLDDFRRVEVSEKMKSLLGHYRTKVEEAKLSLKREAEKSYENSSGKEAGEERVIDVARGVSMTFCWCPAGDFMMGSPENEEGRINDEAQVKVRLSKGFWMAKSEVTQAQWKAVMSYNPSQFTGSELPVEKISWRDAQEFIEKLNAKLGSNDGGEMVLPTEAQWEYAARAGELGPYSGGSIDQVAWHDENSGYKTHPVGLKSPNRWGIYDMSGNVFEWCADWYGDGLLSGVDPKGPNMGSYRVMRGGSWNSNSNSSRVSARLSADPTLSEYGYLGFRIARISVF